MLRKQVTTTILIVIVAAAILGSGFALGFRVGKKVPENIIVQGVSNLDSGKTSVIDFGVFWQAWQTIGDLYLRNKDMSDDKKVQGAIKGLVGSLQDPYSEFFSPEDNKKFQQDIQGNFGGIGAELGMKKNQIVVIAPLKDTPASRIGIVAGDQILKINSTSTEGMSIGQAVNLIRGPEGTQINLTIFRESWDKPKELKITRAMIVVPTIDEETINGNISHVSLHSFNSNAEPLFYKAVLKAAANGDQGMILDLRNDPGGYLEVAVDLAGWFLPRGTLIVSEAGRGVEKQEFRANGNSALAKFPVVVLVNGGSASASEILAGALRDVRHIKLIGEKSFGKGTVQQIQILRDGSSIKLTIAHWVLPSGHILEEGLTPDVEVKMTDEDIEKHRDPQLSKAVEILKEEIAK